MGLLAQVDALLSLVVMIAFLFGAFIVLLAGLGVARWRQKKLRREWMFANGAALGLSWKTAHPIVMAPLRIRVRGNGAGFANFLTGQQDGEDIVVFDGWYFVNLTDNRLPLRRYKWFTFAAMRLEADWPHLSVEPETLTTRIFDRAALSDIRFESEAFNRTFEVQCGESFAVEKTIKLATSLGRGIAGLRDSMQVLNDVRSRILGGSVRTPEERKRFASAFIDARMMDWMLSTGARYSFEYVDGWLVVFTPQTTALRELMDALKSFRARIPKVVWDLFPPGGSAATGNGARGTIVEIREVKPEQFVDPSPALAQAQAAQLALPFEPASAAPVPDAAPASAAPVPDAAPAVADVLIRPEELPLRPDDPRLAVLRERFGDDALRIAGLG